MARRPSRIRSLSRCSSAARYFAGDSSAGVPLCLARQHARHHLTCLPATCRHVRVVVRRLHRPKGGEMEVRQDPVWPQSHTGSRRYDTSLPTSGHICSAAVVDDLRGNRPIDHRRHRLRGLHTRAVRDVCVGAAPGSSEHRAAAPVSGAHTNASSSSLSNASSGERS